MTTAKIRELLPSEYSIPTLPDVVMEIQRLVNDPQVGTREIGEVVERDAPILAKVLKFANSAFYGLAGRCTSAQHACTVLGSRTVSNIVTHVGALQVFEHLGNDSIVREIWRHSQRVGDLCGFLAKHVQSRRVLDPAEFYTYGLLHDIGKVILIDSIGEPYLKLLGETKKGASLIQREQNAFDLDHAQVGAFVVNTWSLPEVFGRAFLHHHGPLPEGNSDPAVMVVYLANLLDDLVESGANEEILGKALKQKAVSSLRIENEDAEAVIEFALGNEPEDADAAA